MKKLFVSFVALFVATSAFAASTLVSSGKSGTVSRAGSLRATTTQKSEKAVKSSDSTSSVSSGSYSASTRLPFFKNVKTYQVPAKYDTGSYNNSGEVSVLIQRLENLQKLFEEINVEVAKIKEGYIWDKNSMVTALSDAASAKTAADSATDDIKSIEASLAKINMDIVEMKDAMEFSLDTDKKVKSALKTISDAKNDLVNEIGAFRYEMQYAISEAVDELALQGVTAEFANRVKNEICVRKVYGKTSRITQKDGVSNDMKAKVGYDYIYNADGSIYKGSDYDWYDRDVYECFDASDLISRFEEVAAMLQDLSGRDWKELAEVDKRLQEFSNGLDKMVDSAVNKRVANFEKEYNNRLSDIDKTLNAKAEEFWKNFDELKKYMENTEKNLADRIYKLENAGSGSSNEMISAYCQTVFALHDFVYNISKDRGDSYISKKLTAMRTTIDSECKDGKFDLNRYKSSLDTLYDYLRILMKWDDNGDGGKQ